MAVVEPTLPAGSAPGEKGLKGDALGLISSIVIGVASTAPGYSLAASLGLVVAAVGLAAPAIMWVAFIPMLLVATSYYYLNRVDPDCGTTFSWGTKAFGPWVGWIGGWGIIVADIIVMANLADIAGRYTFLLFGADGAANSKYAVLAVGVAWIVVMTWICYVGIEASARTQWFLLGAELVTLVLFAVVALVKVYGSNPPLDSVKPSLDWLNPFAIDSTSALTAGVLVAIFIYWGWDSLVAVNEETEDKERTPGVAAVLSTIILVAIYVIVSIAAQAYHGAKFLEDNADDVLSALGTDVLGSPLDKLLIIAVLTSASASTQTTILPTTRTSLSMAANRAIPHYFARIHPRYLTPSTSTIWMGVLSVVWYAGLTAVSQNILFDSIAALGPDDRFLLRPLRLRVRLVLPAQHEEPEGDRPRRHRAVRRRADPHLRLRQVDRRPVRPGQLRVRGLVARSRAAARDRDPLPAPRCRDHAAAVARRAGLLPAEVRATLTGGASSERSHRARLRRLAVGERGAREDDRARAGARCVGRRRVRLLHQPARRRRRPRLQGRAREGRRPRGRPRRRGSRGRGHRDLCPDRLRQAGRRDPRGGRGGRRPADRRRHRRREPDQRRSARLRRAPARATLDRADARRPG